MIGRRAARLPSRQSARGADPRGARPDRPEGTGRLHLRRRGALGGRQLGGALPPFPRPRRAAGRRGAARLRAVRRAARQGLGRRPARSFHRASRTSAAPISPSPATSRPITRAMFEAGVSTDADPALREVGRARLRACCASASEALARRLAGRPAPAGADDEPAHLGAVARHRVAVRARRCRPPQAADDARRTCWRPAVLIYLQGLGLAGGRGRLSHFAAGSLTGARRMLMLMLLTFT